MRSGGKESILQKIFEFIKEDEEGVGVQMIKVNQSDYVAKLFLELAFFFVPSETRRKMRGGLDRGACAPCAMWL